MKRNLSIFLFSVLVLSFSFLAVFEAYSVHIVLHESSIQPLPMRESVQYFFSKQRLGSSWAEVRSVTLSTSGNTVTSATITWYVYVVPVPRYVTIAITLRDDSGSPISSGSETGCYSGSNYITSFIDLGSDVNIDNVARVETSVSIGTRCFGPIPVEPLEPLSELGEEYL